MSPNKNSFDFILEKQTLMIIHNIKEGESNEDLELYYRIICIKEIKDRLERSKEVVKFITEDYDSWNFLKVNMKDEGEHLRITEAALENNPKSYQAWHHRLYIFQKNPSLLTKNLEREVGLISILLKFDDRNFHGWNYKAKLIEMLEKERSLIMSTPTNENFTAGSRLNNLINKLKGLAKDVSNYSFLHFNKNNLDPISCIYTDPFDHSCWFYYFQLKEDFRLKKGYYLRIYKKEIEVRFKEIFTGSLLLLIDEKEFKFEVRIPTRIFIVPYSGRCENIKMFVNEYKYSFKKVNDDDDRIDKVGFFNFQVFKEIKELEPLSYLNYIFNWENVTEISTVEYLEKIDPLKKNYYQFLSENRFDIYVINN